MIGHGELAIIVLVILVLFGAAAIPKFARSLGQAKREFTKAMKEAESTDDASARGSADSPAAGERAADEKDGKKA